MNFIRFMKTEFQIIKDRDPAIHTPLEVFLYPSFRAILYYRVAHKLYLKKHYFVARWISQRAARKTGIEIHPGAKIGKGLFIDHGHGVIIGETAVVGDECNPLSGCDSGRHWQGDRQASPYTGRQCYGQCRREDPGLLYDRREFQDWRGQCGNQGGTTELHGCRCSRSGS